jgi:hypothetical protein
MTSRRILFPIFALISSLPATAGTPHLRPRRLQDQGEEKSYVSVELLGQLGNQFFQLAAGYAYALDVGAEFVVPDLKNHHEHNVPHNMARLYSYIKPFIARNISQEKTQIWQQPSFMYEPIPKGMKNVLLKGFFQSEKFFVHRKDEIREVFSPPKHIKEALLSRYSILTSGKYTVGVQVRDYQAEQPEGKFHPTLSFGYYERAMSSFPKDAVFIVSTNNEAYARVVTKKFADRAIYLTSTKGEDHIDHFYILYFCKGFITANSSFGWWASWLANATKNAVIMPAEWFAFPYSNGMARDIYPQNCTKM